MKGTLFFSLLIAFLIIPSLSLAQADFVADSLSGCSPVVVRFTDQSTNAVSWSWDFGNGSTSNLQNPGTTYIQPGSYTISMTATFANGSTRTVTKDNYITIYGSPQAQFGAADSAICLGEIARFQDQSTPGTGAITSWLWDFGTGVVDDGQNPAYSYTIPNDYTVTLSIEDENGCSDVVVKQTYLSVQTFPSGAFTADNSVSCTAPLTVTFSSAGAAAGLEHSWDFGTGDVAVASNPVYTFRNSGVYSVSHIITNSAGCADTVVQNNMITVGQTTVDIQADTAICLGEVIPFRCGASSVSSLSWDFGDGNTSNNCNTDYTFAAPGTYLVQLTFTDQAGCTFSGQKEILVSPSPDASFTVDRSVICSTEDDATVVFTNTSNNAEPVSYLWEITDGTIDSTQNLTHTFPDKPAEFQPYLYNVKLTVTNAGGCKGIDERVNFIVGGNTGAAFDADVRSGCAPLTVNFQDSSYTVSTIVNWEWDFGDGNTSTLPNPLHTYADTGKYDVTLTVETIDGCRETTVIEDFVDMGEPVSNDFTAAPTTACAREPIKFTLANTTVDSVFWAFGDGINTRAFEPEHAYADTGSITVMLVTYNRGCADTLYKYDYINITPPVGKFATSDSIGCELPYQVFFTDLSIGADSWAWDFGDGTTSTEQNPNHTYTQSGSYVVTLNVENAASGCSYALDKVLDISPVNALFETADTSGCFPYEVNFTDLSTNAVSWEWDFGDGNTSILPSPTHTYADPGSYHVKLKIINDLGCEDSVTFFDYITVWGPDLAMDVVDPSDCAPFSIQFFNNTVSRAPVVSWLWDFGDGNQAIAESPSNLYTVAGNYTVKLTAIDSLGCVATDSIIDYILITDPYVDFETLDTINCTNNDIAFTSMAQGVGLTYLWEFGDGQTSTLENPVHRYNNIGTYAVKLTVTDVNNCPADTVKVNYVTVNDPVVNFVADTTAADCPPLLVTFTTEVYSIHDFTTWQWNFGDGTVSAEQAPEHVYGLAGDYTVSLVAITSSGCSDTVTRANYIDIDGPTGTFDFQPQIGCPGTEVSFNAQSPNTTSFKWDFGDGAIGDGQVLTHPYSFPGIFRPILILEDGVGCQVVITSTDSISIFQPPIAGFEVNDSLHCDQGLVQFTDTSLTDYGITDLRWDFGDGNIDSVAMPTHTYGMVGEYSVQLIATDIHGCSDTTLVDSVVRVVPSPVAMMNLSDTTGCAPFELSFADGSMPGGAPVTAWEWILDPTTVMDSASGTFTYLQADTIDIRLAITDSLGCMDTVSQTIRSIAKEQAQFASDDSLGCVPQTINFSSLSANTVSWLWQFGDGSVDSVANPGHLYDSVGLYSVELQIVDVNGCQDTLLQSDFIRMTSPTADFALSDSVLCPGEPLDLTDQSSSDFALTQWEWNCSNGDQAFGQTVTKTFANSGLQDIELIVTDAEGCRDTLLRQNALRIRLDIAPPVQDLEVVSIEGYDQIRIQYPRFQDTLVDFGAYNIYRQEPGGIFQQVVRVDSIETTSVLDNGFTPDLELYCYKMAVENVCGSLSDTLTANVHCTVDPNAVGLEDMVALDWSAYQGWNDVDQYRVYQVTDYRYGRALQATLDGSTRNYLDTNTFCGRELIYQIEAIDTVRGLVSWSDTIHVTPLHFPPDVPMDLRVATVEDDNKVIIKWDQVPVIDDPVELLLERNDGPSFRELARLPLNSPTEYEDLSANVHAQSYDYRISVVDLCKDKTPDGLNGKTVFLETTREAAQVRLNWTPYLGWEEGVAFYRIEFYNNETNTFQVIADVRDTLEYLDNQTTLEIKDYCYRVTAFEKGGNGEQSISNLGCEEMEAFFFTPNAFSPNNDGFNDNFVVRSIFIQNYQLSIYDRWGRLLFTSQNPDAGWDGTVDGRPLSEGVYVYALSGQKLDGSRLERTGTVTLVR